MAAMMMPLLLLAAAPSLALWFGPRAQSRWAAAPIAVDGKSDDWTIQDTDDAEGIVYAFSNDAQYLYMLLAPHTRSTREQLLGRYQQDLTIWIDRKAKIDKTTGLRVLSPSRPEDPDRILETIGISSAAESASARMGPAQRGIFEARIPLASLGVPLPDILSVGIEESVARRWPAHPAEPLEPIHLWVRVTLARKP